MEGYEKRLSQAESNVLNTKLRFENVTAGDLNVASKQLAMGLTLGGCKEKIKHYRVFIYVINAAKGDTKALAAEDCYVIKMRNPTAQSGFYWLAPQCSSHPFRAWCDMQSGMSACFFTRCFEIRYFFKLFLLIPYPGTMIYIWNGNPPKKPNTSILSLVRFKVQHRLDNSVRTIF